MSIPGGKIFEKALESWKELKPKFKYPALIFIIACVLLALSQGNIVTSFLTLILAIFVIIFPGFQEELISRKAQKVKGYDRIQAILQELATSKVRSVKDTSFIVQEVLKEILNNLEKSSNKNQILGKLDKFEEKLGEFIKQLDEFTAMGNEWKVAETWLEEHQKWLVEKAISSVLKRNKWLGRSKREFEENIYEHLKWVLKILRKEVEEPTLDISVLTPHKFTVETHIYRETLEIIEKEIGTTDNELSPMAKKILSRLIKAMINEYL